MEAQPKTSFIPKKPIENFGTPFPVQANRAKGRTLFYIISILIFLLTLALLAGVILYKFSLQKRIDSQNEKISNVKIDEALVRQTERLNFRIINATSLLNNHLSPSAMFTLLEEYTLQSVSFSGFTFTDQKDGSIKISGSGIAGRPNLTASKNFESIILQSDSFSKSKVMKNILFSNLQPNSSDNTISFSFSATLDPSEVLYRNKLSENYNTQD
jgi:hypothetical protein